MSTANSDRAHHTTKSSEPASEVEALKDSFSQLRTDVVELIGHAFGVGRSGAEAAKDGASNAVDHLKDRISDLRDRGADGISSLEHKIEKNPLHAALIAFGVGYVLAKVFSRR